MRDRFRSLPLLFQITTILALLAICGCCLACALALLWPTIDAAPDAPMPRPRSPSALVHRHRSIHEGLARTSEVFETSEVCVPRREVPLCAGEHKGQTADDWRACNFWVLDGVTGVEEEWGRDGEDEGP